MRAAECRTSGPYLRKPRAICLYLSRRHDHAVQMDTRESAVEIIPARGSPPNGLDCGRGHLRENGKAKLIPFLGAAHEGRKLGVGMGVVRLADLPAEWSRQHQMLGLPAQ
jgi:hypothetical protein